MLIYVEACNQTLLSCYFVVPLGGDSVQPSTDAGTGQTAASGEGERGVTHSTEARTEESGKCFTTMITSAHLGVILSDVIDLFNIMLSAVLWRTEKKKGTHSFQAVFVNFLQFIALTLCQDPISAPHTVRSFISCFLFDIGLKLLIYYLTQNRLKVQVGKQISNNFLFEDISSVS